MEVDQWAGVGNDTHQGVFAGWLSAQAMSAFCWLSISSSRFLRTYSIKALVTRSSRSRNQPDWTRASSSSASLSGISICTVLIVWPDPFQRTVLCVSYSHLHLLGYCSAHLSTSSISRISYRY